jgi:sulfite reductase alpha subunit-like flavoprotein
MAFFTTDEMHRERLLEFTQPLYTDEFFDYCTRPRRSVLEVLADFPTVKFPWNQAAWLFPSIRGRQFSIANSSETATWHESNSQREVELLVAIVKYRTVLKKIRQGLCSRYLASLEEGSQIQISFDRPSSKFYDLAFRQQNRPLIMISSTTWKDVVDLRISKCY